MGSGDGGASVKMAWRWIRRGGNVCVITTLNHITGLAGQPGELLDEFCTNLGSVRLQCGPITLTPPISPNYSCSSNFMYV